MNIILILEGSYLKKEAESIKKPRTWKGGCFVPGLDI